MAKPTTSPRWADQPGANITTPQTIHFESGWQFEEIPASAEQNYCMNSQGEWIQYLDSEVDLLKAGGTLESFYLIASSDMTSGIGSVYSCTALTVPSTGQILLSPL